MPTTAPDKPTPDEYRHLFEDSRSGVRVLEDLVARFGGNPYVSGGRKGDRETAYRAGRNAVVQFVLAQINRANGAQEDSNDG